MISLSQLLVDKFSFMLRRGLWKAGRQSSIGGYGAPPSMDSPNQLHVQQFPLKAIQKLVELLYYTLDKEEMPT